MTQFYAYLWLRSDGTPYYAGKGCGRRAYIRHGCFFPPSDKSRIVMIPCATEAEAFAREVELIDLYRRKDTGEGCLRNLTDGGEGIAGYHHANAAKARMSVAKLGNKHTFGLKRSAKERAIVSARMAGRSVSKEIRAKSSISHKGKSNHCEGRIVSAETRQKISTSLKLRNHQRGENLCLPNLL